METTMVSIRCAQSLSEGGQSLTFIIGAGGGWRRNDSLYFASHD